MGTSNTCARDALPSESTAMMLILMGGPAGTGSISSSNRSILLRILMWSYLCLQDAKFCGPVRQGKA